MNEHFDQSALAGLLGAIFTQLSGLLKGRLIQGCTMCALGEVKPFLC